uniref:TTC3/DZIP3-like helical domain-containing protein n=1 Tax=Canis lupus dingo TaxID=286419 RepID=A0A8C0R729_CANLU
MVAIQVSWNITHQEVNTEPYDPFETQQGDISQIEKEFQVLQEQLNEACENYEQRKLKGSEETRDLEEKLKRNLEENKISKTELDWFLEDLEKEIKKWQQEKKEIQESLKALTKKMRKVLNANEIYAQKNDGKEKEHELLLDQSLEISNTFTNEKMKVEECIKKGKENYEESLQRAVAAEVSVLENWKDIEVYKLQIMESQAEGYLKNLRLLSSDSATYPDKESDIHSWESFLSKVKKEIEKAKVSGFQNIFGTILKLSGCEIVCSKETVFLPQSRLPTFAPHSVTLLSCAFRLLNVDECSQEPHLESLFLTSTSTINMQTYSGFSCQKMFLKH